MYVDQDGEIHLTGPEKEKPLDPSELGSDQEIGVEHLSDIGRKVKRYGTAKARNRQMAAFLALRGDEASAPYKKKSGYHWQNHPYAVLSEKLYACAAFLEFHHYIETGQTRLVKATTCKKHLLCPFCAIRRGAKTLRNYHEKALHLGAKFDFYLITLTVKNGPDLGERHRHLKGSFKRLRDRAKKGYGAFSRVSGAVWSTEFTKSSEGWHPHLHIIAAVPKGEPPIRYGEGSQLASDWLAVTGDSFIVHSSRIKGEGDELAAGLCEVLKYAVKFSDLDLEDNLHAYETLRGQRLIQASGCFFGLDLPEDADLLDDPLDGPYITLFFRYGASGYRLATGVSSPHTLGSTVYGDQAKTRQGVKNHDDRNHVCQA